MKGSLDFGVAIAPPPLGMTTCANRRSSTQAIGSDVHGLTNAQILVSVRVESTAMKKPIPRAVSVIFIATVLAGTSPVSSQSSDRDVLRDRIDMLFITPGATVEDAPIAAVELVDGFYSLRDYRPAWTDPAMVRELFDHVVRSVEHGLNPDDFHAKQLGDRLHSDSRATDPAFRANTEILCTDAVARLAIALQYGKLDPADLDPAWNFSRTIVRQDPLEYLNRVIETKTVSLTLSTLGPQNQYYRWFQNGLKEYRAIKAAGGWTAVSPGPVLSLGSTGSRVEELRQRLRTTGDLKGQDPADPAEFDDRLAAAVEHFQMRHGIDSDGKVGPGTLEELNRPVDARIDQLRASLERMRWVYRDLPKVYLIVDIAGFRAYVMKDGEEIWGTRVQVGKPFHATPIFKDVVTYLEFNPTWTIPPGIFQRDTLPAIRKDQGYLSRNNMTVLTTSGKIVDPSTIDWAATANKGFPYMIRQEPGDNNALGRVKFMFPNKYMVYLHDTPSKGLFARSERTFSSGCIRTENPFELAELLLKDQGWDRGRIDQVLASKRTTRVNLENPITVMLLYWTAEVDKDGTVFFRRDVYNRDPAVIIGLDEPFRVSLPRGAREAFERR
jgi:murein L,D-transpeptidase YcbB/YkuD